jgi:Protein phosphatase 2C
VVTDVVSGRWCAPRSCSVIGAAHRRRGQPCQDASLAARLITDQGEPLQLMAVADGHGNKRHWLSQVGSVMACRQAEAAVQAALAHTPLLDQAGWRRLLRQKLPAAIVQGWLTATAEHWAADWAERQGSEDSEGHAYSSEVYGCTLGLVLMAPQWWGYTGLGDWDLVRIDATGQGVLISEEPADAAAGEATASLCLPQAPLLFGHKPGPGAQQ